MVQFLSPEVVQKIVADKVAPSSPGVVDEYLRDPDCGPALRVYLALEEGLVGQELSELDRLYNRYYWMCRFANLYTDKFGLDEGIEQQVFGILSDTECEVDWTVIEELHDKAAEGISR